MTGSGGGSRSAPRGVLSRESAFVTCSRDLKQGTRTHVCVSNTSLHLISSMQSLAFVRSSTVPCKMSLDQSMEMMYAASRRMAAGASLSFTKLLFAARYARHAQSSPADVLFAVRRSSQVIVLLDQDVYQLLLDLVSPQMPSTMSSRVIVCCHHILPSSSPVVLHIQVPDRRSGSHATAEVCSLHRCKHPLVPLYHWMSAQVTSSSGAVRCTKLLTTAAQRHSGSDATVVYNYKTVASLACEFIHPTISLRLAWECDALRLAAATIETANKKQAAGGFTACSHELGTWHLRYHGHRHHAPLKTAPR